MVSILHRTKLGPKGQIVVPKVFRENLGIFPGEEVEIIYRDDGLVLRKNKIDIVKLAEDISKKGKSCKIPPSDIRHMEISEKWQLI